MSNTIDDRIARLEEQLNRAQRRGRWLMVALTFGAVALLAGMAAQSKGPGEVRATSFILEDAEGRTRAKLAMLDDGPGLVFRDEGGRLRAGLAVSKEDGGMLMVRDEAGKMRFSLTTPGETAKLMMWQGDQVRASLTSKKEGATLSLGDAQGKPRAVLNALGRDVVLMLNDEDGSTRLGMGVVKKGPSITLQDETGKVVWRVP